MIKNNNGNIAIDFVGAVFFVCSVFFIIITGACSLDQKMCSNYQDITGCNTKYLWYDSCYVETKQGWQRWDEYKQRATASEVFNNANN